LKPFYTRQFISFFIRADVQGFCQSVFGFPIFTVRFKTAFDRLIEDWKGIRKPAGFGRISNNATASLGKTTP
jgi:hypothetical protein